MHKMTNVGMLLMASIILVDRFIYSIPDWMAVILFIIVIILFTDGMIRKKITGKTSR